MLIIRSIPSPNILFLDISNVHSLNNFIGNESACIPKNYCLLFLSPCYLGNSASDWPEPLATQFCRSTKSVVKQTHCSGFGCITAGITDMLRAQKLIIHVFSREINIYSEENTPQHYLFARK